MIRHRRGDEFLLFTQNDHALLAGLLAGRVGNREFAALSPLEPTVQGIALHDSGWPAYDENPTLDAERLPTHFMHSPLVISMQAWTASVERAMAFHPWSGLLASQHALWLSSMPHEGAGGGGTRPDPRVIFDINKFQHRQIEIQETLRRRLGLQTEIPLTLGLAQPGSDPDEDLLLTAACWLRALDSLSLEVLCDRALSDSIDYIFARPGLAPQRLMVKHLSPFKLSLTPWPFDLESILANVPFRSVPAREFSSLSEFRGEYSAALPETLSVQFVRG